MLSTLVGTLSLASEREQQSTIEQTVLTILQKASFNGSMVVAKGDDILAQHSVGFADAETKVNLNKLSGFALGSVTKEFNAVAIMMLHEKGLLNINQPLSKYFPELRGKREPHVHLNSESARHHQLPGTAHRLRETTRRAHTRYLRP